MKNIFSILFIFCAAFAFAADDRPIFEADDENECRIFAPIPFSCEIPVFEQDNDDEIVNEDETQQDSEDIAASDEDEDFVASDESEEDSDEVAASDLEEVESECCLNEEEADETVYYCCNEEDESNLLGLPLYRPGLADFRDSHACYSHWDRFKTNFGMEKIFIRFPQQPAWSQSSNLFTAYAYDHAVMYSFAGFFPPVGNIDPILWFDEILHSVSCYPYSLISHTTFQVSNGDWVMDYVAHDYSQNLYLKARAIVTPFNGYILQCVKPNGVRDYFDYYLDNFWIKCECHH